MATFECRQDRPPCGEDATWHVLWEGAEAELCHALVCRIHRPRARTGASGWVHPIGADCAMPGAIFDRDLNDCFVPPSEMPPAFRREKELTGVG